MTLENKTEQWWDMLLNDEEKLHRWLIKLLWVEKGGFDDYSIRALQFPHTHEQKLILRKIALDEEKHSRMIEFVLRDRGITEFPNDQPSSYWGTMFENIKDVTDYAAASAYGEIAAANRFSFLVNYPFTPDDLKDLFSNILPDEQFHVTALTEIAGKGKMNKFRNLHIQTMRELTK